MRLIETRGAPDSLLTVRQRWANVIAIGAAIVMLLYGLNLRNQELGRVVTYFNPRAGITAFYPANWLLDVNTQEYVFRVRDMTQTGFKTTIQISIRPVGPTTAERNIADRLAIERAPILTAYSILSVQEITLREERRALAVYYTFTSQETSPFLEGIPSVALALDIIEITRGQAIVITYRADASRFEELYPIFERFLNSLEL